MKTFQLDEIRHVANSPFDPVIEIDLLELSHISINFEPEKADEGHAILSIGLVHRASGYKINVVYRDESALSFWRSIETVVDPAVFNKLITDNKLPAGTLRDKNN